ncbi:MAG: GTP 3',8-cyclase MoaA [Chloroflexi bacterium]|nr:GTP 3',8-cyclase MoaA [Chloroflexota bacterium]
MKIINPVDQLNRPLRDLRISVTDRCNFRCTYCMPAEIFGERYEFLPKEKLLSFEEIYRIAKISVQIGVKKIRITGGEPLVRQDIPDLIEMLSEIDEIDDIAMTTNAYLLEKFARDLKSAGLNRITVSLDSLDDDVFQKMNGRGFDTSKVKNGILEAKKVGLSPIKINAVVQKNVNDHTILDLIDWCRENNLIPRFIEYMDVGNLNHWNLSEVIFSKQLVEMVNEIFPVEPVDPSYPGEVAKKYRFLDGKGEFGVISSVSQPFCGDCTRLRLSPEGEIFTCLFAQKGLDLRAPIRSNASDDDLLKIIQNRWQTRNDNYSEQRSSLTNKNIKKVEMYHIGG